jgi:AcrR family transcriptional regulator
MSEKVEVAAAVDAPGGKSARTRAALRAVAVRHFVEHGFERASVPAIAAECGVTERTFYRHFATKDEVLFGDVTSRLEWFRRALRGRPVEEDLAESVRASLASATVDPRVMVEIARLRAQLLTPERIEQAFRVRQGAMVREVRELLEERGVDPLTAVVRSEVVAGAVLAALTVWTEQPEPHDVDELGELTAAALAQVRPVLG